MRTDAYSELSSRGVTRRDFLRGALAASGGLALAACAPRTGALPPAPPAAPGGGIPRVNTSTKVAASHFPSILTNAQLSIGKARGFWDEYGLTQEMNTFGGGGDIVRGITSGANQYGVSSPTGLISAFVRDEPVRMIGCSYAGLTIKFVVLSNSPYRSIGDLAGRKVGYSTPGSNTHFISQESLKVAGVRAEIVSVGGAAESITALRTGIVDCTWTAEPVTALNQDIVRVLWDANTYVPDFMETVLATMAPYTESNGDVLRAFMAGYDKANDFIKQSPADAARVWASVVELEDKADLVVKAFTDTSLPAWTLRLKPSALEAIERSMRDLGLIDQAVNWKEFVDQRFLPENMRVAI